MTRGTHAAQVAPLPQLRYGRGIDSMSPSVETTHLRSDMRSLLLRQGCGISSMVASATTMNVIASMKPLLRHGRGMSSMVASATTASRISNMRSLLPRCGAASVVVCRAVCIKETEEAANRYHRQKGGRMAFAILGATSATVASAAMSDQLLMPSGAKADERADNAFREHYALLYFIAASRFRLPDVTPRVTTGARRIVASNRLCLNVPHHRSIRSPRLST